MGFLDFLFGRKKNPTPPPEEMWEVTMDDDGLSCRNPDGIEWRVEWRDVESIVIRTSDKGPWEPDLFWIFEGRNNTVIVPQGAKGEDQIFDWMEKFEGFSYEASTEAATCVQNKEFLCWKRKE